MSIVISVEQYNEYISKILRNRSNTTWIIIDSTGGGEWNQGPIYKKKVYMDEDKKLYVVYGPNNGLGELEYLQTEEL